MAKYHRDYKALVKSAEAAGWTISVTGKSHPRLNPPKGAKRRDGTPANPVTIPSTPSDHRGLLNTRADLRRQGLDI